MYEFKCYLQICELRLRYVNWFLFSLPFYLESCPTTLRGVAFISQPGVSGKRGVGKERGVGAIASGYSLWVGSPLPPLPKWGRGDA